MLSPNKVCFVLDLLFCPDGVKEPHAERKSGSRGSMKRGSSPRPSSGGVAYRLAVVATPQNILHHVPSRHVTGVTGVKSVSVVGFEPCVTNRFRFYFLCVASSQQLSAGG